VHVAVATMVVATARFRSQRHLRRPREPAQSVPALGGTTNAVSARLFSAATACRSASSTNWSSTTTAAGSTRRSTLASHSSDPDRDCA